jgi:S-adenosylmethionine:tRNA ribosyltransferase-isomerase
MAGAGMTSTVHDISFRLPRDQEATGPAEARGLARDQVRLLVSEPERLTHSRFRELPRFLRRDDIVVVNNSAAVSAALDVETAAGPGVLHVSTWLDDGGWVVELRTTDSRPWAAPVRAGDRIALPAGTHATLREPWLPPAQRLWIADVDADLTALLAAHGRPISYAYLRGQWAPEYYRTVFGLQPGSAEMPSASRPFTDAMVTELVSRGVVVAPVTLHTGVSSPEAGEPPSPERFEVPATTARLVNAARAAGGRLIAVGTTVVRALESAADERGLVRATSGWTELVLGPRRPARVADGLVTGWHAPGASHLQLLEAVVGTNRVRAAYAAALNDGYLWHEFGDSALLLRS